MHTYKSKNQLAIIRVLFLLLIVAGCTSSNKKNRIRDKRGGTSPSLIVKAKLFPYNIVLNATIPGAYNTVNDSWVQPFPMPANQSEVRFTYTLENKINTIEGWITAKMNGIELLSSAVFPNKVGIIAANTNFVSEFHATGFAPGIYKLYITYLTKGTARRFTASGC